MWFNNDLFSSTLTLTFSLSLRGRISEGFHTWPDAATRDDVAHGPEEERAGIRLHHHRGRPTRRVPAGEERAEGRPCGTGQQDRSWWVCFIINHPVKCERIASGLFSNNSMSSFILLIPQQNVTIFIHMTNFLSVYGYIRCSVTYIIETATVMIAYITTAIDYFLLLFSPL